MTADPGSQVIDVPNAPPGTPYGEREDARAAALLEANGLPTDDAGVTGLLGAKNGLVAAAAARVLGARGATGALERLGELAASPNDLLAVHAAAGLAGLDPEQGRAALRRIAALPVESSPGAIQAAGELARLGDRSAAAMVQRALATDNPVLRSIAAKQLYFLAEAGDPDALPTLGRLLHDDDPGLPWIAMAQLTELDRPEAREMLEQYVERGPDAALREVIRHKLEGGEAPTGIEPV